MDDLKNKSIKELAFELNIIRLKMQKLELEKNVSSDEYDALLSRHNGIVLELWDRIPELQCDINLQLQNKNIKKKRK